MADSKKTKTGKKEEPKKVKMSPSERIDRLEQIVCKIAAYTGQNHIIQEFNLETWQPSKKDMQRWDDYKETTSE